MYLTTAFSRISSLSKRTLRVLAMLGALVPVTPLAASRIKDLTQLDGGRDNQLVGYGLIVGLAGDGDSNALRLPPVNVVCAIQTARGQQHNKKERRASEADDNGREYERLWNRIGVQGAYRINQRHGVDAQAPHGKNEEIDRVGKERQPHDDLKGARTQQQVDTGTTKNTNRCRKYGFHQGTPVGLRGAPRRDWWAIATSMSTVAPKTSR